MDSKKLSIKDMCMISIFAAMTAVLAQIAIPLPFGVPLSLQTFAVCLSGMILGSRKGAYAMIIYVLLGLVGVPVFAEFSGGVSVVFGPSGGFILSFPLMAYIIGVGVENTKVKGAVIWGLFLGVTVNWFCGMIMFSFVTDTSLALSFVYCVLPFIPLGIFKAAMAGVIGVKMKKMGVVSF